ncbi:MAG: Sorting nexin mvp1 [Pycnora praestabilis]|nr:MAG: Sorting nexin mvp1 [Pycnora praestabilis]
MSLFGSSPDEPAPPSHPARSQASLFDDEPTPTAVSKSSLFADDNDGPGESPWGLPTPKKAAKGNLVKTLLPPSDVPESYVDTLDLILNSGDKLGAGVSLTGLKKIMNGSALGADDQAKILEIVVPGGQESATGLGRGEFNVLLALIGLAQEGEDVTLDGVDERRKNLPEPSIPYLESLKSSKHSDNTEGSPPSSSQRPTTSPSKEPPPTGSPTHNRNMRKNSLEFPEADPWASPALHKGHNHATDNSTASKSNGDQPVRPLGNGTAGATRTTSTFTTQSETPTSDEVHEAPSVENRPSVGGWGSYDSRSGNDFTTSAQPDLTDEGFGSPGAQNPNRESSGALGRSIGGGRVTGTGIEEVVVVTTLPEKEGMFMFQHRNYEVASARRGSKVIRRYSDFVWLLDCLHKRYPFRQLPLLPPKRVAVNGRHLSSDISFIEKRRRGLSRFCNALVRHPILNQEQLVVMFLTVPTHQELAVWRKQATISVQEEFVGKSLPPTLEDSLPTSLPETFETVRAGVKRSAEIYINLCTLLERLAKRNEGVAADYLRFSLALQSLTELSEGTYAIDTNDVPLLNEGVKSTAKHLSTSQSLLEDEARAWDLGVLEDLKRQRDTLVAMRDMFDRRDRYATDNIPQLERRIQNNENKLAGLKARDPGSMKPGEIERVEDSIFKDKELIVQQHARGVFIRECIRDELIIFQQSQYHVSRLHQDWSQERIKYAELQADNWRALSEEVEGMPLGE